MPASRHLPVLPALSALALLALLASCTQDRAQDRPETASRTTSSYTTESAGAPGVAGTHSSPAFETDQILPAVRSDLARMEADPAAFTGDNLNAHKKLVADLVNRVGADLTRLGVGQDYGDFRALGDSIVEDTKGGTGEAAGPTPKEMPAHVARVRRLIAMYEQARQQRGGER
jgi:hypothetical protein